jgi:hypothetical protein
VRTHIFTAAVVIATLSASVAEARHFHFAGPHPVAAKYGGGYCYIETPHMHIYAPDHAGLYQQVNDQYVFTGDPTPFGYDGEKYKYYGHHPVTSVNGEPVYCYIEGPHYHSWEPPSDGYKVKSGVAFYVGPFTPGYAKLRPQRVKVVNAEYRPYAQYRPTVEVQPPSEWQGEVYVAPPAVEVNAPGVVVGAPGVVVGAPGVVVGAPGVVVGAPGVVVNAPPPVVVGAPGVVVHVPGPPVVVAPPAPRIHVVGAPPPVVVARPPGVFVEGPRPRAVVVEPPPPRGVIVVEERERHGHWKGGDDDDQGGHHDHGKHKGWYK